VIDRIAILGGSSVYIPELIQSIISRNVNVKEIVLFGREGDKLPVVAEFCKRLIHQNGFPGTVVASTDLEESVTGAKYILNHVRVGGMKARLRDEKLPLKDGMIGDETLGAGGFANAMRTLPVVLDFVRRIEAVNPDCTFINLTNPMGIVMEALVSHSRLRCIGVCDLPGAYIKKVSSILHRDPSNLKVNYIGLNHMGWIQDVRCDGDSCFSSVLDRIEEHERDGFDYELIKLFRVIPTRPVSLFFHRDEILKKQTSCARYRAEDLFEAEQQILELYRDKRLCSIPSRTRERNTVWYEETIVPLIEALEQPKRKDLVLCVRNDGAIRDLPEDCSVEVPVTVSNKGLRPRRVGSTPHFLTGLFQAVKQSDRLTVEAVLHHSYEYALQALTIHPLVPSLASARRFLDRLIKNEKLLLR
jgi:6-phospho-beta-glucosidase